MGRKSTSPPPNEKKIPILESLLRDIFDIEHLNKSHLSRDNKDGCIIETAKTMAQMQQHYPVAYKIINEHLEWLKGNGQIRKYGLDIPESSALNTYLKHYNLALVSKAWYDKVKQSPERVTLPSMITQFPLAKTADDNEIRMLDRDWMDVIKIALLVFILIAIILMNK